MKKGKVFDNGFLLLGLDGSVFLVAIVGGLFVIGTEQVRGFLLHGFLILVG